MHRVSLMFTIGLLFVSFGLLKLFGLSNHTSILLAAVIILFVTASMFSFFTWRNRKISTKEEKFIFYQSIFSSATLSVIALNGLFVDLAYSIPKGIFLVLFGLLVVIAWEQYIRRNPELSNQKFQLVTFLAMIPIMIGCGDLLSSFGFYVATFPIIFIMVGFTTVFMFQDKLFRN